MKTVAIIAVFGLAATGLAKDERGDFKKFIAAEIPKIEKAFDIMDPGYFDAISTPDFTEVDGRATMTKAQAMQEMKQQAAMSKSHKCHLHLLSAEVKGGVGIAMTHGIFTSKMKPDQKGKTHVMYMEMWEKETWVRSGAGWKIRRLEEAKPGVMKMDGKLMTAG